MLFPPSTQRSYAQNFAGTTRLFTRSPKRVALALAASLAFACSDAAAPVGEGPNNVGADDDGADDDGELTPAKRDAAVARDGSVARDGVSSNTPRDAGASDGVDAAKPGRSDGASADGSSSGSANVRDASSTDGGRTAPGEDAAPPSSGGPTAQCGGEGRNLTPFGCSFAWGTNDPVSALPNASQLGFISKWVGYEVDKAGTLARCDGCSWLGQLASGGSVPVYYAYFIGFFGSANGFADQNVNPNGPNLATDGAQLIRDHRAAIVEMYASYAKQSARAWPNKPLVWLLEGDFAQYTYKEQKGALSMSELGALAHDITCAIRGNMPNAVVAINHSTWLSDEVTNSFWGEMEQAAVPYDMVWTTGVANNMGFLEKDAKPDTYNHATATYAYLAKKTGRKILVDTSFGLSGMSDTWASATPETLNARIADGVIAANVTMPPATYVSTVQALSAQLNPVCER